MSATILSHMGRRRSSRVAASFTVAIALAAVITAAVVVGGGTVAYRQGLLNTAICDGPCGAAYVDAPRAVQSGAPSTAGAGVGRAAAGAASGAAVQDAIEPLLGDDALGGHVGFAAYDLATGEELWSDTDEPFVPASTTKMLTAYATLAAIPPDTTYTTSVRFDGSDQLALVGGGDPYLLAERPERAGYPARASLELLAERTATALESDDGTEMTLTFDDSLFEGPGVSRGWPDSYVSADIATSISALWADQGMLDGGGRSRAPAQDATEIFAEALRDEGVDVADGVERAQDSASFAEVADVRSAPSEQIVETALQASDNAASDVLLRHVAIAAGEPATFEGGTTAVREVLAEAGLPVDDLELDDGSGLARSNRISPSLLAMTTAASQADSRTAGLGAGFPVAAFNGTLRMRFERDAQGGRGLIRAKTGTLSGVSSIAGVAETASGHGIAFAAMADDVASEDTLAARDALDRIGAALAECDCGSSS